MAFYAKLRFRHNNLVQKPQMLSDDPHPKKTRGGQKNCNITIWL